VVSKVDCWSGSKFLLNGVIEPTHSFERLPRKYLKQGFDNDHVSVKEILKPMYDEDFEAQKARCDLGTRERYEMRARNHGNQQESNEWEAVELLLSDMGSDNSTFIGWVLQFLACNQDMVDATLLYVVSARAMDAVLQERKNLARILAWKSLFIQVFLAQGFGIMTWLLVMDGEAWIQK